MSGFQNITGFAPPNSPTGFMGLLQAASFRGIPFKVIASEMRKGRKVALHDYPFRDGGWAEDMGRALRTYSFTGYLIGDIAPALQLALDSAAERKGSGLLVHPSVGAQEVALIACSTSIRKDQMRIIEVRMEFIEQGQQSFLTTLIATAVNVAAFAGIAQQAGTTDFSADAAPALVHGAAVTQAGANVLTSFGAKVQSSASDPAAAVRAVSALPGSYGRYASGSATVAAPAGATAASLIAGLTVARSAVALAVASAQTAVAAVSEATDIMATLTPIMTALAATARDPADQIRLLNDLSAFAVPNPITTGSAGISAAVAAYQAIMADAIRRAVVIAMALSAATYQPSSYQDAATIRAEVTAALDAEITIAGDSGDDASYAALRDLRAAVADDLATRGASLAAIETVNTPSAQPALVVAYSLYADSARSDDVIQRAAPPHPAFCPISMQLLAA